MKNWLFFKRTIPIQDITQFERERSGVQTLS
jgi:hypothetical protein